MCVSEDATCAVCGNEKKRFKNGKVAKHCPCTSIVESIPCLGCGVSLPVSKSRGRRKIRCDTCDRVNRSTAKAGSYTCCLCGKQYWSERKTKYCGKECQHKANAQSTWSERCCVTCGKHFTARSTGTRCCSPSCARFYRHRNAAINQEKICVGCGAVFLKKKSNTGKGLFCSRECAFKHPKAWWRRGELTLQQAQERKDKATRKEMQEAVGVAFARWANGWKQCVWCSRSYWTSGEAAVCGSGCSQHVKRGDYRKCELCGCEIDRRRHKSKRTCAPCGKARRVESRRNIRDKHELNRKQRMESQFVEHVSRAKVFRRDRYKCWICLGPCKRKYIAGDMASPTLDHVVPVSKGGLHSYKNCRTAHAICNSLKSDME